MYSSFLINVYKTLLVLTDFTITMSRQDQDSRGFGFGPNRKRSSFLQCFDRDLGGIDFSKLSDHVREKAKETKARMRTSTFDFSETESMASSGEVHGKKRRVTRLLYARRTENGEKERIKPEDSWWYTLYISCPMLDNPNFHKKFRRRFRLPYEQYLQLVEDAITGGWFPRWTKPVSYKGRPTSPVELLMLGSLRYLGRGFTFDDCEESTAVCEEVHRVFFHEVSSYAC